MEMINENEDSKWKWEWQEVVWILKLLGQFLLILFFMKDILSI